MKHTEIPLLLVATVALSSCSSSTIATVDPKTGITYRATKSEWDAFTFSTEFQLQRELRGELPDGGHKTWEDYWCKRVQSLRKHTSYSKNGIDFIKDRRKELKLPLYDKCFAE